KTNPDWILNLDVDELVEDGFWPGAKAAISNSDYGQCCFRLYDMWNEHHYREDALWNAHRAD
ncbi:MAG: glycosyl transferase, partial [Clostridiales bacterium]